MDKRYGIFFSATAIASAVVASIYFMDSTTGNQINDSISSTQAFENPIAINDLNHFPAANTSSTSKHTEPNKSVLIKASSPEEGIKKIQEYVQANNATNNTFPENNLLDVEDGKNFFTAKNKPAADQQLFLKAKKGSGILIGDARDAKKLLMQSGADFLDITEKDDLELLDATRDEQGMIAYKFEQSFDGIKVFNRQAIVETRNNNELALVMGDLQPNLDVNTTPDLTANEALSNALNTIENAPTSAPDILKNPKMMIYVDNQDKAHLTYVSVIKYITSNLQLKIEQVFVDAHSGQMVARINRMHSALNREIYTLNKQCLQRASQLPGTSVAPDTDNHTQPAYDNAGITYWFYKHMFNRDSYDNKGIRMRATVHAKFSRQNSNQCSGDNAFFTPDEDQVVYGEGGQYLSNPAGSLDISAHEWTHGLTSKTSNLTYQDESGALNESFSDVLGAVSEGWSDSGGSESGNPSTLTMTAEHWKIGEDSASEDSGWVRFLNNPTQDGKSRDNYNDRYTGSEDNGGVHINSGISNLAFYLLTEGGSHPNSSVSTINVQGIGVEKSVKLFYKSFISLNNSADFSTAANRVVYDAGNEYGECSQEKYSAQKAFESVKVTGDWSDFTVTDSGECAQDDPPQDDPPQDDPPQDDPPQDDPPQDDPPQDDPPQDDPSGANHALGSSTDSSSSLGGAYTSSRAVDGNNSTQWVSRNLYSPYQSEWLSADFGSAKTFNSMTVKWNSYDFARIVSFWVWDDSQNGWREVSSTSNGGSGTLTFNFANQTSQYVYVSMSYGNYRRWFAINEFEVR